MAQYSAESWAAQKAVSSAAMMVLYSADPSEQNLVDYSDPRLAALKAESWAASMAQYSADSWAALKAESSAATMVSYSADPSEQNSVDYSDLRLAA